MLLFIALGHPTNYTFVMNLSSISVSIGQCIIKENVQI